MHTLEDPANQRNTNTLSTAQQDKIRILIALNDNQITSFFPDGTDSLKDNFGVDTRRINPSQLTPLEWEKQIIDYAPTVLVSCWSTPPLPASAWQGDTLAPAYLCHLTGTIRDLVPKDYLLRGGRCSNWGNLISHSVAEHGLLLTLAALRNLPAWVDHETASSKWSQSKNLGTRTLRKRKVGIHGFGNIARELVKLLKPFNVDLKAYSEGVLRSLMFENDVTPCDSLESLFEQSEIVIECEALTDRTYQSVNADILNRLPDGAIFVNIGRGAVVDEDALAQIAKIKGFRVACDVLTEEPLSLDHPFCELDSALISPHIAGPTSDLFPICGDHAISNIQRFFNGETLLGEITPEVYERIT